MSDQQHDEEMLRFVRPDDSMPVEQQRWDDAKARQQARMMLKQQPGAVQRESVEASIRASAMPRVRGD